MLTRFLSVCLMLMCVNSVWGCELSERDLVEMQIRATRVTIRNGTEKALSEIEGLLIQNDDLKKKWSDIFLREEKNLRKYWLEILRTDDKRQENLFRALVEKCEETLQVYALSIERDLQGMEALLYANRF